jgi:Superfamily II helicase and inactivated derivatives
MLVNDEKRSWHTYQYPDNYFPVKGKIIFDNKVSPDFDGKNKFEVSRTLFTICGKTKQLDDGTVYFTIRYAHGNQQKEFQLKQSDLLNKKSLGAILTSRGINVPDNVMLGKALEYVSIFIKQFGDQLKTTDAVISNGWNEDCSLFALGETGITINGCSKINTAVSTQAHVDPFHTKGTLEGWINAVNSVMDYTISRFLFYDAMSAPLKKLLSIESHTIVHYGPTSKGKTAQENLISSTFGDPKQLEVLAGSTKNGIIAHVAGLNDIPVDLEEATVPEARKNIADAIYDIANGKEKNRCKTDSSLRDDIKTFRTTVHVTCENPLRENIINAGGVYRMGQVGDLLPEGLGKIVSDMKRQIQKNYGHFYPLYIQNIIKNMDTVEDL